MRVKTFLCVLAFFFVSTSPAAWAASSFFCTERRMHNEYWLKYTHFVLKNKLEEWQDTWLMTFNPKKYVTSWLSVWLSSLQLQLLWWNPRDCGIAFTFRKAFYSNIDMGIPHKLETCIKHRLLRRNLWGGSQDIKATAY